MSDYVNVPSEFRNIMDSDEELYWTGKPAFIPFVSGGIPFLIFGLCWGAFDYFGIIRHMGSMDNAGFLVPFMAVHMFPFYGSILNMVRLVLVHKNTFYAYTNKRLLFRSGFFGIDFRAVDYDRVSNLEVNVNPLERIFNVGTVRFISGVYYSQNRALNAFISIHNPYEIFKKIKEVSVDIKTDWNYPNKLRPDENPGYNSKYTPRD